jgi:hypothetical protein
MVALPNRFYRGVVHSPKNPKHPNFRFLIVDTVYDKQDENGEWYIDSFNSYEDFLFHNPDKGDSFYGVYGSYWIDIPRNCLKISETFNLQEAILIAESIMGNSIIETTE